jgi:hypothetical protein
VSSRYVDSVPLLQRSWIVEGFIWQLDRPPGSVLPNIPKTLVLVGEHPSGKLLLAGESPLSGSNDPELTLSPWPLQIHNDSATGIPLAFLDESGRYVQLESFSASLDGETPIDVPTFCRFLCGQTTGAVHVCD